MRHPALWPFFAALALNLAGWAMSFVDGQRQRLTTWESHDLLVRSWRPAGTPAVDVFLPTRGEPLPILDNTFRHLSALRWNGPITVWVLDDAARAEVADLAERYGFRYSSRADRGHLKKAGNLNHGLSISSGDLVAVFDADFCPRPDFLAHLVPYLEDPEIAVAQSPQYFDTAPDMPWLQRTAGAAQEMFYRWLQPSRDADGGAICVGTNVVYRRSTLEEIGGFPRIDHSEDIHTSVELMRRGYRTKYVPVLLAKGLSPDNVASYVAQQYRWAMGCMSLLFDRDFHRTPMPWRVRLSYYSGFLSYFVSAVNIAAVPLPGLVMLAFYPEDVRAWHMIPFVAPLWVALVLLPAVSVSRWRFEVVRAQTLYSYCHLLSIVHAVRDRAAAWVPSGAAAGRSRLVSSISRTALAWLTVTTAATWAGIALRAPVHGWDDYWALTLFACGTTYITLPLIRDLWRTLR
ncbi:MULTISPECIES: glycosyltransferase family 2 protein [Streptosporangium]|uniref:Cellulose synthase (UDP-forming) n=1 Tax=Streptosporangium brasiliense TaxID=47480 RepID=A0ABT9RC05_9ACTN|nr:cellulose synthase catalytic subunit [Streptosporangium brasiliense]MDP9866799.1 cellulose synthase (UDP-forming) [Streptosporangium brasiliense]